MLFAALFGVVAAAQAVASSATVTFSNVNRFLFDSDGNQVDAYGSKVNFWNNTYYLYGNSFSKTGVAFGIKSYSSIDLVNWKYEGFIFDTSVPNPCLEIGGCGRPHILYNHQSQKYILWANAGSSGYIVATSLSPVGPFEFLPTTAAIDPNFNMLQPADFAVEVLQDKAYLVFSALNFRFPSAGSIWPPIQQTLHISPLTSDYLNTTLASYPVTSSAMDLIDQEAESPDIFMRNGLYYITASNTCGYCNGSISLVYRASSIGGPWTRQIISDDGCKSQAEGVLPLPVDPGSTNSNATTYVWHGTSVPGGPRTGFSGHIFQPLRFNSDDSVALLDCRTDAKFSVPFTRGSGPRPNGNASSTSDSSPPQAVYKPVCDSDRWVLYQTWTSSESGILTQVAVNIARSVQTVPLTLNVFRFSNLTALTKPEYKWTELGNATYNATKLSYTFDTASVFLNASVSKGEKLGVQIAGADYAPYCHLEYDLSSSPSDFETQTVLLQQGQGQNSWRGLDGKRSVVYEREGKGVKMFAVVQ